MDSTQCRNLQVIKQNDTYLKEFKKGRVLLLSPNYHDLIFWKNLLPDAEFTVSTIHNWDLNQDFENSKLSRLLNPQQNLDDHKIFDITIAQNVFMYLKDPNKSITNIAKLSDYLFIQDLKYRKRSNCNPYFGIDGDITRYSIGKSGNLSQSPLNLSKLIATKNLKFTLEYTGGLNEFHTEKNLPIHILALIELNSRSNYSEFRRTFSEFSKLCLRAYHVLKLFKSGLFRSSNLFN